MVHSNHHELSPQPTQREMRKDFPQDLFKENLKQKRPPTVTIMKSAHEIYAFVRNFENHLKFMRDVKSVQTNEPISHWTLQADSHTSRWDTEVVVDRPGEMLAWRTVAKGDIKFVAALVCEKAPGDRGTIVSFKVQNEGLMAGVTETVARFLGKDCDTQAAINLRRLKAYLEAGEVPTIEGQSDGRDQQEVSSSDLH